MTWMAGTERRATKPRNTARMGLAETANSASEWREVGAQVNRTGTGHGAEAAREAVRSLIEVILLTATPEGFGIECIHPVGTVAAQD